MNQSIYDILMDYGLTEDDIDQIMGLGELQTESGLAGRQMSLADAMRQTPGAQGRRVGRIYRRAVPAEHMGTLANRLVGAWGGQRAEDQMRDIASQQTEARGQLLRALGRRRQGVTAPGASAFGPPQPATTTPFNPPQAAPRSSWAPYYG